MRRVKQFRVKVIQFSDGRKRYAAQEKGWFRWNDFKRCVHHGGADGIPIFVTNWKDSKEEAMAMIENEIANLSKPKDIEYTICEAI